MATGLTVVMTVAIATMHLGTNLSALVRVGDVMIMSLCRLHHDLGAAVGHPELPLGAADAGTDADAQRNVAHLADRPAHWNF